MALSPAQLVALKVDILADPTLSAKPQNSDGAFEIAAAYNLPASPTFTVWRTTVSVDEIAANGIVWSAVDTLTVGKARIWDWMTKLGTINPSKANVRQGLADCFGAGSATATATMPLLKRTATRAEKLFASGTGSDASPGTMTFEGSLSWNEVFIAMGW